jgi:heat shock protein HtpX
VYEEIARNKRRTVLLIAGSFVFLGAFGFVLGYAFGGGTSSQKMSMAITWMTIGLVIAGIQSFVSLRYGDKLVLASTHAKLVTPEENPRLHNIVEGIAIAAGIPKPAVYVIPEQAPNAFATGRDPDHSSIAVTEGLLAMMNRVELEGVIAHELSHIQDRDMLIGTVVATLVGAVVLVSEFFLRWMWWGGGGRRSSNDSGGGAFGLIMLAIGIAMLILAPICAQLIKMSVSRRREYLADAQGAMLTRYPPGLAAALRKIAGTTTPMRHANNATAHLWLAQPSKIPGEQMSWMEKMFSTHPPIQERIRILEEM